MRVAQALQQAAIVDRVPVYPFSFQQDCLRSAEANVGRYNRRSVGVRLQPDE